MKVYPGRAQAVSLHGLYFKKKRRGHHYETDRSVSRIGTGLFVGLLGSTTWIWLKGVSAC